MPVPEARPVTPRPVTKQQKAEISLDLLGFSFLLDKHGIK